MAHPSYAFDPPMRRNASRHGAPLFPTAADGDSEWVRGDVDEHVRDDHSTYAWLLEPMIERSGFRIECTGYSPDGFFADYVARAV